MSLLSPVSSAQAYTLEPITWNIVGLDSNSPAAGPNRFPVGARVCGGTSGSSVSVSFDWENPAAISYINLRSGSAGSPTGPPLTVTFGVDGCADAYFEAEVTRTKLAFDTTRSFQISVPGASTPMRELYVEYLVSQSRNYITSVYQADGASPAESDYTLVADGGTMDLMVGNTYSIRLHGSTATQGYNQFESFINFANTIFKIHSVSTTYSANTSPFVPTPNPALYADACLWENDPASPYYRSCFADYKTGGDAVTTYVVEIIGGGGTTQTLNTLLYDFSGSSFHYNADYSTKLYFASITDPLNIGIEKEFAPTTIGTNDISVLTFTLSNPNSSAISDVNFTDPFPTGLVLADPLATSSTCGGTLYDEDGNSLESTPVPDDGISLRGATIPANGSCTVTVNVTSATENITGYDNVTGPLKVGTEDTGKTDNAILKVNNSAVPDPTPLASCIGLTEDTLATWTMPASGQGSGGPPPPYTTIDTTAVASATASFSAGGTNFISTTNCDTGSANCWEGRGWASTLAGLGATPYYQFDLVTQQDYAYGGVSITLRYLMPSGNWAAPANNYMILDSDGGTGFTQIFNQNVPKTNWTTVGPVTANTTGKNTTKFKVRAYGAKSTNDPLYLDNITIKGCKNPKPPTISKKFYDATDGTTEVASAAIDQTTTLIFTISNPNTSTLNQVTFSDEFPAGMEIAARTPIYSSDCAGSVLDNGDGTLAAGDKGLKLTGGTLAPSTSCTISVNVVATAAGTYENTSGFISAQYAGSNTTATGYATDTLAVLDPPLIEKTFSPDSILTGSTSTLTFTINNPNLGTSPLQDLNNITFTDAFPASMEITDATPLDTGDPLYVTDCGAIPTDNAGGALGTGDFGIKLTGVTLAPGESCSLSVEVTAPADTDPYVNDVTVSHDINGDTIDGNTATGTLAVNFPNPPLLLKQVGPTANGPWSSSIMVASPGAVYYRFTVENAGVDPLYDIILDDGDAAVDTSNCIWPQPLPVADALDNDHIAYCVTPAVPVTTGPHSNTATVTGTYDTVDPKTTYTSRPSTATYDIATLQLVKSADKASFYVSGETITYTYAVTNNGAGALSAPLTISDNKIAAVTCASLAPDNDLDPGDSVNCTATYTTTAADVTAGFVTNLARATIGGTTSPTVNLTVPLAPANVTLVKMKHNLVQAGNSGYDIPGEVIRYTLTLLNSDSRAIDADSIELTDPIPAETALLATDPVVTVSNVPADTGLTLTYVGLTDATDQVEFSIDGTDFDYQPVSTGGIDPNVTHIRFRPTGSMAAGSQFSVTFKVRIK